MSQKNISLREIERSIKVNATIDKKAGKALQLHKWHRGINQGIGRSIFIYIARQHDYTQEAICDYLAIKPDEYNHKVDQLSELYTKGEAIFHSPAIHDYASTCDSHLNFYRKLLLAQSYLRWRFGE
jgi:hypothetical protein